MVLVDIVEVGETPRQLMLWLLSLKQAERVSKTVTGKEMAEVLL